MFIYISVTKAKLFCSIFTEHKRKRGCQSANHKAGIDKSCYKLMKLHQEPSKIYERKQDKATLCSRD
jgi:hypothetical protein